MKNIDVKWKPIETAPHDKIILCCEAFRTTKQGNRMGGHMYFAKYGDFNKWMDKAWIRQTGDQCFPTHWLGEFDEQPVKEQTKV